VLQAEEWIEPDHLALEAAPEEPRAEMPTGPPSGWDGLSLREIVRRNTAEVERSVLTEVLRKTGGNKAKAARLLKIDYTTLHAKLKQYGIKVDMENSSDG
jgi:two-component system nitrogen regulation response regulator GlnG